MSDRQIMVIQPLRTPESVVFSIERSVPIIAGRPGKEPSIAEPFEEINYTSAIVLQTMLVTAKKRYGVGSQRCYENLTSDSVIQKLL